jgi:hypothetical protein
MRQCFEKKHVVELVPIAKRIGNKENVEPKK